MEITVLHWMVSIGNLQLPTLFYLVLGIISLSLNVTESGQLHIWGRALVGEHDDDQPRAVFPSLSISQVALGWHHALVLSGTKLFHINWTMFPRSFLRRLTLFIYLRRWIVHHWCLPPSEVWPCRVRKCSSAATESYHNKQYTSWYYSQFLMCKYHIWIME